MALQVGYGELLFEWEFKSYTNPSTATLPIQKEASWFVLC